MSMSGYNVPKCEHCDEPLRDIYTKTLRDYSFNELTGRYKDAGVVSHEMLCSNCERDVYETLNVDRVSDFRVAKAKTPRRAKPKSKGLSPQAGVRGIGR